MTSAQRKYFRKADCAAMLQKRKIIRKIDLYVNLLVQYYKELILPLPVCLLFVVL
ncbi:unnamed protein product [Schistosoma intercalatum]|nr:unnamed protein product [Schistosoma intercalatum]